MFKPWKNNKHFFEMPPHGTEKKQIKHTINNIKKNQAQKTCYTLINCTYKEYG